MTTNYPGGPDTPMTPVPGSPMDGPSHAGLHDFSNDAIVALENTLGFTGAFNFIKLTDAAFEAGIRLTAPNQMALMRRGTFF